MLSALAMALVALSAWGGLGWLVLTIPPARPFAVAAFYVFAFTALASTAACVAWLGFGSRPRPGGRGSPAGYVGHAMLFAAIALFALWLQSLRMLTPVVALLLLGLYVFLELALLFGTRGGVEIDVPSRAYGAGEP